MKYTVENNVKFAQISVSSLGYLLTIGIGDFIITKAQTVEVRHWLELMDKDGEELQAIRNSVVRYYGALSSTAREMGDMEAFFAIHNTMSGVTAVIDDMLWNVR